MDFYDYEEQQKRNSVMSQYKLMVETHEELKKKLKTLDLLYKENIKGLMLWKASLYSGGMISGGCFKDIVTGASNWIGKLERKEVRKNCKNDDDRKSYDMLFSTIKLETGIEVKKIDKIIFEGYENYQFHIHFTDAHHGEKLRLSIPNIYCPRYKPGLSTLFAGLIDMDGIDSIIRELDTVLYKIESDDDHYLSLCKIVSFPENTQKLSDFTVFLDDFAEKQNKTEGNEKGE